jgi:hypothetical protein
LVDVIDAGHLPVLGRPDEPVGRLQGYRVQRAALAS